MRPYTLLGHLSRSVAQASHQPFLGALKAWLTLAAKAYCAWCCYFSGVTSHFGRFTTELLTHLRSLQWLPSLL